MFRLFEVFADAVREQADDYARAQARIGSRTLRHAMDPFGMASAIAGATPLPTPVAGTELRPPRLNSERRIRRKTQRTAKPRSPRNQRPALNFA